MPIIQIPTRDILFGPSPIDWCEENHPDLNPWQWEELHNTWSNVAYVVLGVVIAMEHVRQRSPSDPLFLLSCFCGIMTGVTSAWFHATLIFVAQKSDEFFENAMITVMVYCLLFPVVAPPKMPSSKGTTRYGLCLLHLLVLAMGTFFIREAFAEIHLLLNVLSLGKISTERIGRVIDPNIRRQLFRLRNRAGLLGAAAFAFWGLDFGHCTPLVQSLNLHAFAWHFGTALALAYGGTGCSLLCESYWIQANNSAQKLG